MTKGQKMRKVFGPQPAGPAACLRSCQQPADCPNCGAPGVTIAHLPTKLPGRFCRFCCPCCARAAVGATTPLPGAASVAQPSPGANAEAS